MRPISSSHELLSLPDALLCSRVGGKALGLVRLLRAQLPVPPFFVVEACAWEPEGRLSPTLEAPVRLALLELGPGPYAVRSSAVEEDGERASFAGQLESFLGLEDAAQVLQAISACQRSGSSERVRAYRRLHGLPGGAVAVVVQRLVDPEAAGVLFTATPEAPEHVLISATFGLGEGVVQGSAACDTWQVGPQGEVVAQLAEKDVAVRLGRGGTRSEALPVEARTRASLDTETVRELARLGRALAQQLGRPLDIEFAHAEGQLWLLQARPVTVRVASGRRLLWDNSNIVESFSGTTTPMTFSFAARSYAIVYQLFCRVMGVREEVLRRHAPVFERMVGLVRGRVYYNLNAWYLVLTLLPGFQLTRRWMEQMMGVSEVASDADALAERKGRVRAGLALGRLLFTLVWRGLFLERDIRRFRQRVEEALAEHRAVDFSALDPLALVETYAGLERRLLWAWTPPIVNDFFLMVDNGAFRQLCARWLGEEGGALANALLTGEGVESAVPAAEARRLAERVRVSPSLLALFGSEGSDAEVLEAARQHPSFAAALEAYLERFGERCVDELKLEVPTLAEAPEFMVGAVRACLRAPTQLKTAAPASLREEAEAQLAQRVRGPRRWVLGVLLRRVRRRMRQRESLRFLRTRVFGLVRRLVRGGGERLVREGVLEQVDDVWLLGIDELWGYLRGTALSWDLRGLVALRRQELERWRSEAPPAERFHTLGAVPVHNHFRPSPRAVARPPRKGTLAGVPCCPGMVDGPVRVLRDARDGGRLQGEILVAERTDPGWVPLFPSISGLLIERGSVLSHSAVVARELGIPTIVGIRGLTGSLPDGSRVRMDGSRGTVERVA